MRKVNVKVVLDLTILADEGVDLADVLGELEIVSGYDGADVEDWSIEECQVIDSR